MNEKRMQELKAAQMKLVQLVEAVTTVAMDSTAREVLAEVLKQASYGRYLAPEDGGTVLVDDYGDLARIALAHAHVRMARESHGEAEVAA
jgi:phage gp45-like